MIPTACSAAMPSQTGAGALASAPSTALPDGIVVEPAAAGPLLVRLGVHGAHHPDGRLPAKERLRRAAAALEPAVGALLQVRAEGGGVKGKT